MLQSSNLECLQEISNTNNPTITEDAIIGIKGRIRNYGNFYYVKHDVPGSEVFFAAAVNARKLEEICSNVSHVKIFLAKTTPDNNNIQDFHFIIMPADVDGLSTIDSGHKSIDKDKYLDSVCCKNPPPNAITF